ADVDAAVQAADRAFPSWSATVPEMRADVLFRAAELVRKRRHDLSALMVLEVGKSWDEADGETAEAVDLMEWYGRQMLELAEPRVLTPLAGERTAFYHVPLGAGVVISPWNFPLALATGMATAALVAGNTVVLKPASTSATTAAWLVDLLNEAGLPDGVLNYITGPGSAIGDALVDHPRTRFVAFTGSRDVGVRINERGAKVQAGQIWLKRIQLEMGGKNAIVVDETADLDAAADGIVTSAFGFQGQKCSACSRAVVVDSVYESLLEKIIERGKRVRVGDPVEPETQVGPVIDAAAEQKVRSYITIGREEGSIVLGGGKPARDGYFVEPTIIAGVAPKARVAQEEIFGPVLSVIRVKDFDEALAVANGTAYGLTGSLYSRDHARLERAKREFHVGNLYLNRKSTGAIMGVHPFGGFNMSGTDSKAGGPDYLLFYLQGKAFGERI
ncbi:MAG TPA: L-glutamate gamma-semialdehyde dehydrogenase, partial [Candidatus Limnocylindria bacterium]|nr:L-glutamate gamma-semialdehyde dehydrogenase [Candidatus Limnocylindria bacterium]